jgi:hypothetical protein
MLAVGLVSKRGIHNLIALQAPLLPGVEVGASPALKESISCDWVYSILFFDFGYYMPPCEPKRTPAVIASPCPDER